MYHSYSLFTIPRLVVPLVFTVFFGLNQVCCAAKIASLATSKDHVKGGINLVSTQFPSPPAGRIKEKAANAVVYQYDTEPLGDREPFLLVHGLRGEFYPYFRWRKVVEKLTAEPEFHSKYKIYLMRYSTLDHMDDVVPQFRTSLQSLYQSAKRPITIMALSIGGNLVFEGMKDHDTDNAIKLVYTLGTPFHGSPLFTEDWLKYSMYKRASLPITKFDHNVAYKLYFDRNPLLLEDFGWDDADKCMPSKGPFRSLVPFGPSGDLDAGDDTNRRLVKINEDKIDKTKLVTYSGFLSTPYALSRKKRLAGTALTAPYTVMTMDAPAHIGREHPVLKLLNREIGAVVPSEAAAERAGTPFVYSLNDGITPVSSAVFLPGDVLSTTSLAKEEDLPKVGTLADVRIARVFRDCDHLTFIDGYRPRRATRLIKDEANPKLESKEIFDWMLTDILHLEKAPLHMAGQPSNIASAEAAE